MGSPWDKNWDDAAIALLTELWLDGHTSGACARALGVSRSAAIGKLGRLGLMRRDRPRMPTMRLPVPPAQNLLTSNEQVSKPPKKPKRPAKSPDKYFLEYSKKHQEPQKTVQIGNFALLDLRNGNCRWPEGDRAPFRFCGMPQVAQSSYCEIHTKRSLSGLARGTPYVGQRMARS